MKDLALAVLPWAATTAAEAAQGARAAAIGWQNALATKLLMSLAPGRKR